jgi:hypothetical protein
MNYPSSFSIDISIDIFTGVADFKVWFSLFAFFSPLPAFFSSFLYPDALHPDPATPFYA